MWRGATGAEEGRKLLLFWRLYVIFLFVDG
jgi:hypothetical protein